MQNYTETQLQVRINEIIDKLFSFHRFGIKPGLERTLQLCEFMGNPQRKFQSIHIAGTNGKGSTSSMTASILIESGLKIGLYTSPHIMKFNERIQINGQMISDFQIVEICDKLLPYSEAISATFFEITTVLAFQYFAENNIDIAVIETGMGGRFDSTNVVMPIVSVITKIAIDHTEYLGDTIELITMEKAGIIKSEIPVIIAKNDTKVTDLIKNHAVELNSQYFDLNLNNNFNLNLIDKYLNSIADFQIPNIEFKDLKIALAGNHQLENVLTVLNIIKLLNTSETFSIDELSIRNGLKNVKINTNLKGRIELIQEDPPIVIDVSHNSNGVEALVDTIKRSQIEAKKWNILFSALEDKDITEMMSKLSELNDEIVLIEIDNSRATKIEKLVSFAEQIFKNVIISKNKQNIISELIQKKEPLLVAGSFYLINEFLSIYNQS